MGTDDPEGYGLGWLIQPSGNVGHGGAYSKNMAIDFKHGIAFVWLIQHAGFSRMREPERGHP